MKKLILFLTFLVVIINVNAQDSCLVASEENVPIIARNILQTYSQLDLHGITPQQAAIDSLDRWEPVGVDPNWINFKKNIKDEIRRTSSDSGNCIDDYSLKTKDDCWNNDGLCVEGRGCVGFEDLDIPNHGKNIAMEFKSNKLTSDDLAGFSFAYMDDYETLRKMSPIFLKIADSDLDHYIIGIALDLLGGTSSIQSAQLLEAYLANPSKMVTSRIKAAKGLGKLGYERSIPSLISVLKEDSLSLWAIKSLGDISRETGSLEAISVLREIFAGERDARISYTTKNAVSSLLVHSRDYSIGPILANNINDYFESGSEINFEVTQTAVLINRLHDLEARPQDQVRTEIIQNLDTRSLYYLIAIGGADLYTSTFLMMYKELCNNSRNEDEGCRDTSFIDEIDSIDPEGRYKTDFFLRLSNFNKLNEVIAGRENFFNDILLDSLTREDPKETLRNSVLLTSTIQDIFTNPSLGQYKPFLENLLIDNYNQAVRNKDRLREGIFAYFIKLNSNEFDTRGEEASRIAQSLPEVQSPMVPAEFLSDNKVSAKLYFYTDEEWWKITINWLEQDGFRKQQVDEKTSILTKTESGKVLEVIVTTDKSDVAESIENPNIDIIGHRGHSFHLTSGTFAPYILSSTSKLLYLGSCGSFGSVPELQKQFPNAYFLADEDTGRGSDNHRILLGIMRNIAQGERNWENIKQNTYQRLAEEPRGIIWPYEKSFLLYNFIQRLTGMSADVLIRQQYGYLPEELFPTQTSCSIQTVPYGETIS